MGPALKELKVNNTNSNCQVNRTGLLLSGIRTILYYCVVNSDMHLSKKCDNPTILNLSYFIWKEPDIARWKHKRTVIL